jgi:hypothetical protein
LRGCSRQAVNKLVVPIIRDAVKEKRNIYVTSKDLEVPSPLRDMTDEHWTAQDFDETIGDENGLPALSIQATDVNCC